MRTLDHRLRLRAPFAILADGPPVARPPIDVGSRDRRRAVASMRVLLESRHVRNVPEAANLVEAEDIRESMPCIGW